MHDAFILFNNFFSYPLPLTICLYQFPPSLFPTAHVLHHDRLDKRQCSHGKPRRRAAAFRNRNFHDTRYTPTRCIIDNQDIPQTHPPLRPQTRFLQKSASSRITTAITTVRHEENRRRPRTESRRDMDLRLTPKNRAAARPYGKAQAATSNLLFRWRGLANAPIPVSLEIPLSNAEKPPRHNNNNSDILPSSTKLPRPRRHPPITRPLQHPPHRIGCKTRNRNVGR